MSNPAEEHEEFRPRHTVAQMGILGLNVLVILGCLAGSLALLWGKHEADLRLQTPKVAVNTTVVHVTYTTLLGSTVPGQSTTSPTGTFPAADPQARNFLITGSDANACVDPNSPWAGAADPARDNIGSRSDTIMVMRVDPSAHQAAVLSFPRDLWVPIHGRGKNRINSAYIKDDYSLLAQTIYDNFGVVVDHYIQVDFCAFKRIVDAVGGVGVPFSFDMPGGKAKAIVDPHVGIDITAPGCHVFHGDEALAYVRSRHLSWVDSNGKPHEDRASDFGRISRQQDFLRRVLQTALDHGLFDPSVARALIKSLQTDVVTEQGFTIDDMLKFAGVMHDIKPDSIRQYQIEASRLIVSGNDVLQPQLGGANMKAILAIFQGRAPLAGAPEQVFDTTTSTSVVGGTTASGTTPSTTTANTVAGPAEVVKGDILPQKGVTC
jgi:LCP family protein required for cell wall assembly